MLGQCKRYASIFFSNGENETHLMESRELIRTFNRPMLIGASLTRLNCRQWSVLQFGAVVLRDDFAQQDPK